MNSREYFPAQQDTTFEDLLPSLQDTLQVFMGGSYSRDDLKGLESMTVTGSLVLTESTDPETVQSVMNAREEFFGEMLGWDDPSYPLAASYDDLKASNVRLIPIATFIRTQSYLQSCGLDGLKILLTFPTAISYAPEGVRAKMENFAALGLDGVKIVNSFPTAIGYAPEGVRAKMENFAALGLDGVKIVNSFPTAIGLAPEGVRAKINALVEVGLITHGSEIPLESTSQIANFFILPIENLLLYIAHTPKENIAMSSIALDAKNYARKTLQATNGLKRKQEFLARLPKLYEVLGGVAIDHANYMKLPKGFTLLRTSKTVS